MDEHVLQRIVSSSDTRTLASLATCSRLLRGLVAGELTRRACCKDFQQLLGIAAAPTAAARAAALLAGTFRRQFLSDLAAAQCEGKCYDGRRQQWDLLTLPQGGKWLAQVDLLISDQQHVLLYSASFELLGALSFVDRPACVSPAAHQHPRARVFWGLVSSLLFKCRLRCGLLFLEPPLLLGAPDYALAAQLLPCQREELATLAAGASWQRQLGVDDDVHLIRLSMLRLRLLCQVTLLGGGIGGCLDNVLLQQMFRHQGEEPLRLQFLDVSGTALSDASLAQLLWLCPRLRVLRAAESNAGAAVLAALAGRQAPQQAEAAVQGNGEQQQQGGEAICSTDNAGKGRLDSTTAAALQLGGLVLSDSDALSPCPMLQELDLSGCLGVKGSALRRALRCLTQLTALRLNGCTSLHAVLDTLLAPANGAEEHCASGKSKHGGGSSSKDKQGGSSSGGGKKKQGGSSGKEQGGGDAGSGGQAGSKAAAVAAVLGQLTTLEVLDADDVSTRHVAALLRHCTSLRRLALSGKLLSSERLDRQLLTRVLSSTSHGSSGGTSSSRSGGNSTSQSSSGGDSGSSSSALPSLLHLTVGYGTGGTFVQQLAASSPNLVSLTCGLGAEVSDWHLEQVAGSCTALARLCLKGGNVTDQGVEAVLQRCPQLTSLHLLSCTGPFTGTLAASPGSFGRTPCAAAAAAPGAAAAEPAVAEAAAAAGAAAAEAAAVAGPAAVAGAAAAEAAAVAAVAAAEAAAAEPAAAEAAAVAGAAAAEAAAVAGPTAAAEAAAVAGPTAAEAAAAEAEWSRPPAFRLRDLRMKYGASSLTDEGLAALLHPDRAAVRCLVLAGCSRLSDAAWSAVAQHAGTLECLQLESCGALPTVQKGRAPPGAAAALTAGAAVEALSACRRLQALTIRDCVAPALSQTQRDRLCTACTALQTLDLS